VTEEVDAKRDRSVKIRVNRDHALTAEHVKQLKKKRALNADVNQALRVDSAKREILWLEILLRLLPNQPIKWKLNLLKSNTVTRTPV